MVRVTCIEFYLNEDEPKADYHEAETNDTGFGENMKEFVMCMADIARKHGFLFCTCASSEIIALIPIILDVEPSKTNTRDGVVLNHLRCDFPNQ